MNGFKEIKISWKLINISLFCIFAIILSYCFGSCSKNQTNNIDLGDTSNVELIENGKLFVAIDMQYYPFERNNSLSGLDIDIVKLLEKDLSLKVEFKNMNQNDIITALLNNEVDIALTSMKSVQIQNDIQITAPFFSDTNVLAVNKDSSITDDTSKNYINSPSTKIAFFDCACNRDYVDKTFSNLIKAGYDSYSDILHSVISNDSDLCLSYKSYVDKNSDTLKIVQAFNEEDEYVVAISKNAPNLYQAINKDIAIRLFDGTIKQLIDKWIS